MNEQPQETPPLPAHDRLLDAAEQLVASVGVSNLTLDAVAREAGVSKGGLLYHFPSKFALITAIVERLAAKCDSEHLQAIENDGQGGNAFARAYLAACTAQLDPHKQHVKTALLAAAGTDPRYLDPIRTQFAKWQTRLESDAGDPVTATIIRLAADGLAIGDLLGIAPPTGELRRKVLEKLLSMTLSPPCGDTQP